MAVAFDAAKGIFTFGATSLTTATFTIGSGANRAAFIGLHFLAAPGAITAGPACGGVTGTALSGATVTSAGYVATGYKVIAPAAGTQTASCTWTTSVSAGIIVITATGVDQTTPMNGGCATGWTYANTINRSVTSTSGDLTTTILLQDNNKAYTTDQTYAGELGTNHNERVDYGPGTGTTTHTWSFGSSNSIGMIGGNFVQAASGGPASVTPTTLALTTATFAPTITAIGTASVVPTTLALITASYAPTVTAIGTASLTPTTLALTLTAYAPTVTAIGTAAVTPTTAALTLTGYAPTVTTSAGALIATPICATARLVATQFAVFYAVSPIRATAVLPSSSLTIIEGLTLIPGTLALTLTTYAPTVTAVGTASVIPTTKALTLTTFAPTVTVVGTASLIPTTAALTLTTYAPTITAIGTASVIPTTKALVLSTYAPTVTALTGTITTPLTAAPCRVSTRVRTTGVVAVFYATPARAQARVRSAYLPWQKYIRASARLRTTGMVLVYYATPVKTQTRLKNATLSVPGGRIHPDTAPCRATAILQPALLGIYVDVAPIFVQAVVQSADLLLGFYRPTPIRASAVLQPALLRRIFQTAPIRAQARLRSAVLHPQWRGKIRVHPRLIGVLTQKSVLQGIVRVQARVLGARIRGDTPLAGTVVALSRLRGAALTLYTRTVLRPTPIVVMARLRNRIPLGYPPPIPAPIRIQARCLNAEIGKHGFVTLRGRCVASPRLKGAIIRRVYQTAPIRVQVVVQSAVYYPQWRGYIQAHPRVLSAELTIIAGIIQPLGTGWCRGGARLICYPFTLIFIPAPPTPGSTGGRVNYTGPWPMFSGFRWSEEVLGRYLRKKT